MSYCGECNGGGVMNDENREESFKRHWSDLEPKLKELIAEAFSAVYDAGVDVGRKEGVISERKRILTTLGIGESSEQDMRSASSIQHHIVDESTPLPPSGWQDDHVPARQRAPKGLPRALIIKALKQNPNGLIPTDILDYAETDYERMVKLSTIRGALKLGEKNGEFVEAGGVWMLTASNTSLGGAM